MSKLVARLNQRYVSEGDELARDAIACIRELEATLNTLVSVVDPTERKGRSALRNANALLLKLSGAKRR